LFKHLFLEHPTSLGEGYWQHQRQAFRFGITLVGAGCACLLHALVPAFCVRTGSSTVAQLHQRMSSRVLDPLPAQAAAVPRPLAVRH
jgi:hypothetical protein